MTGRTLIAFVALALPVGAAEPTHPIIAGFERFHTTGRTDATIAGQLLLGELNCTSCHLPAAGAARRQAPVLDEVGTRVRVGFLKKFLDDPQRVKPGSTMPRAIVDDPERASKIEALVHFLASTGTPRQDRPDLKGIVLGRDLYHKIGCVACHGPRDALGQAVNVNATVVPLGDVKSKYSITSLAAFLEQPHRVRPAGRMPALLNAKESKDIANYLLQGIKVDLSLAKGTTTFRFYEGQWDKVPDYSKLTPKSTGLGPAFDLGIAARGHDYAIRFSGYFKAEREGNYKFTTESDDGSLLFVDSRKVVDNDGIHPPQGKTAQVFLAKGVHKIDVDFLQVGGGADLTVSVQGPGIPYQNLASLVSATEAGLEVKPAVKKSPSEDDLDIKPELAEKGREVFATAGCANCHSMKLGDRAIAPEFVAPALNQLKGEGEGGCLTGAKGTPRFGLSLAQRAALSAAIKNPAPPSRAPKDVISRTMQTLNCYACHTRDNVGGVEEELNAHFQTTQKEMGDEARVPPPLGGVGAKLNTDYFKQMLDKGVHDRPYMYTRMPGFGAANVTGLVEAFAAADKVAPGPSVAFNTTTAKVKAAGRFLTGAQALSCIKCHTFAGQKAEGTQGIDMTVMTKRVQRDWFHRYLSDPQKVRPGTRMPASWPDGNTFYPQLLDGKVDAQIESIWVYLSDGSAAQLPIGMGKQSIPLTPKDSAIIYRNFIQGAGTRAIGVGFPEKLNLAFDANELRLALLWQGAFIDAAKHWTDRGVGFEGPLGDNVLKLTAGAPFAVLANPDAAWPSKPIKESGGRFLGYRLAADDRPTFLYSFNEVKIADTPNPTASTDPTLRRTLVTTADKGVDGLYFRAAVGDRIEPMGDGWFKVDGWKIRVAGATGVVRKSGGKSELIVPLVGAKSELLLEYAW